MKRILIVDDNKQNLYMAEVLFSGNGYIVETAVNGKDALEKAYENIPNLILSDILMPGMDGFTLCREWQADENLRNIPFVFYTATYTEPEDEKFALSLGADRFIVKPADTEELLRITGEVLNEAERKGSDTVPAEDPKEEIYLRQYNQALIHKLEDKLIQLEETNKRLENEIMSRKYAEEKLYSIEKQLIQLQKMEALGTLAGGIAHDFNNILMAIMGHAEIALIRSREGKPEERNIELMLKACNRAKELINQILTFSRQTDIDKKPVQINKIITEVLKLLRSSLPALIEIKQRIESDSIVIANPTQIYQVIMNLCTNASHAISGKNGIIEVRLSDINLDSTTDPLPYGISPGLYQRLEVIDNGIGIDKDQIMEIFNPYFTTKMETGGTGLGLSLVQNIVKDSGGVITVESKAGEGTAFSIYFPVFKGHSAETLHKQEIPAGGNENILFIDDDPTLIEIGVELLKKLGYRVNAFKESSRALQVFRERPSDFDLVISDISMPGMSGLNLSNELLKIRRNIPVILCTGFSDKITEQRAEELGVKAFLMKPFILNSLSETIRKVLDEN